MGADEYKNAKPSQPSLLSELMTGVVSAHSDHAGSADEQRINEPQIDFRQIAKDSVSALAIGTVDDFLQIVGLAE